MKKNNLKKMFVKSYGCQMNVYDSEKITSILENKGMTEKQEINKQAVLVADLADQHRASGKAYNEFVEKSKKKNQTQKL